MLQKLNERIQGVIAWIVIILIAITFTLFGIDYYMQSRHGSEAAVSINGEKISDRVLEEQYRRAREENSSHAVNQDEKKLKQNVINTLVKHQVTQQAAFQNGFNVSLQQADAAIVAIPQFQEDGHFSAARYQQALSSAHYTSEGFRNEVRRGMLLNQQRFAFMGTAFVLPQELNRFAALSLQTRDYDYLEIPAKESDQPGPSLEAIQAYYTSHHQAFIEPQKVIIEYIRLSMTDLKQKIMIDDTAIEHYYDENQSNFLTPAEWQVAHILFSLPEQATKEQEDETLQRAEHAYQTLQQDPNQFSNLVKKSDDALTKQKEGLLPWITAGTTNFDKVLTPLTKTGQFSAPTRSKSGYEIFKLIAYRPAITKPLNEVSATIKEQLIAERLQTDYARALENLNDLSYQSPDSLQPAADALNLQVNESAAFSPNGGKGIAKNKQIVKAAFSHDVLQLGNNSEPIPINNESLVVLRVKTHIPAQTKSLNEVKGSIEKILAREEAATRAKTLGEGFLALPSTASQVQWMDTQALHWKTQNKVNRDATTMNSLINELAFSLTQVNQAKGLSLENGNYVVVRLKAIHEGKYEDLDKEKQTNLLQQLEANYGAIDYNLYINSLIKKAKIDYN